MSASEALGSLEIALSELAPGGHVCSVDEHAASPLALTPFVRIGLERREQCVYITREGDEERVKDAFRAGRIDVGAALQSKALVLLSPRQAGLKGEAGDPYRLLMFWKRLATRAREAGFPALRGTVEMEWVLSRAAGMPQWLEYERQLTPFVEDSRCLLLCQYSRASAPAEHLLDVVRSHPSVITRGTLAQNIYHVASVEAGDADPPAPLLESLLGDIRKREHADRLLRQRQEEQQSRSEQLLNAALAASIRAEEDLQRSAAALRDAEVTLRATQSQLARVSRLTALGEITASIAHEVNQPLAAVLAYGDTARRWLGASPPNIQEAEAACAGVVDNARRARDVIARIRLLAGKADGQREALDINGVMEDVIALTHGELRQSKVGLRTEFDAALPAIFGDRVQLQQVGLNLIMNAVEAMSSVTDGPRALVIRTWNGAEGLQVAIRDSGVGVREDSMQIIFEPFYTTKPQGIGMGLSISRSIIQAHNGRLWIERNEGGPGVTAHFVLPVDNEAPEAQAAD